MRESEQANGRPATSVHSNGSASHLYAAQDASLPQRNGAAARSSTSKSLIAMVELALFRKLMRKIGSPPLRIRLWNGEEFDLSPQPPVGTVIIRSRPALRRLIFDPSLGLGDGYMTGGLDVEGDLAEILTELFCAMARANAGKDGLWRLLQHYQNSSPRNTRPDSRRNVEHHYDLGNDFYKLWLDEQLLYTCAYYPTPDLTIEQAQVAKLDLVCRKLRLKPGETVIEAGCGWGALAIHMAQHYGVLVTAFNLSREQVAYARNRVRDLGLAGRVEFVQDDYRNITQSCDAFVSVGMLEHVGPANYRELGGVMHRVLKPHGRGLLHTIGRNQARPLDPWTERRIFPGACPPSLKQMMDIFEPYAFSVLDVENLRLHYARTLQQWLERFERAADQVERMFDAQFVRMWRFYLAASIASFRCGELQLFQVVFARAMDNSVPRTRADIYQT